MLNGLQECLNSFAVLLIFLEVQVLRDVCETDELACFAIKQNVALLDEVVPYIDIVSRVVFPATLIVTVYGYRVGLLELTEWFFDRSFKNNASQRNEALIVEVWLLLDRLTKAIGPNQGQESSLVHFLDVNWLHALKVYIEHSAGLLGAKLEPSEKHLCHSMVVMCLACVLRLLILTLAILLDLFLVLNDHETEVSSLDDLLKLLLAVPLGVKADEAVK